MEDRSEPNWLEKWRQRAPVGNDGSLRSEVDNTPEVESEEIRKRVEEALNDRAAIGNVSDEPNQGND